MRKGREEVKKRYINLSVVMASVVLVTMVMIVMTSVDQGNCDKGNEILITDNIDKNVMVSNNS